MNFYFISTSGQDKERGFTLIGLALTMVVIGLLIGFAVKALGPLLRRTQTVAVKSNLEQAKNSITGYAATNLSLPVAGNFASISGASRDPWGNDLYYILASGFSTAGAKEVCGRGSTGLSVLECNDEACLSPLKTT